MLEPISILIGNVLYCVACLYLFFKICRKFLNFFLKENASYNLAQNILLGFVFASYSIYLNINVLQIKSAIGLLQNYNGHVPTEIMKFCLLFLFLSIIIYSIVAALSIRLFALLTRKIDEVQELKNNNLGIALCVGIIVFSIAYITSHSYEMLLDSFLPHPTSRDFDIRG
jgi:hypothetical protein